MAILVLGLWMLTVVLGVYMLVTSTRPGGAAADDEEAVREAPAPVTASRSPLAEAALAEGALAEGAAASVAVGSPSAAEPAGGAGVAPGAQAVRRGKPPRGAFDPPSLVRAKSEPMPGMRAFAEFLHPALAICGFGFWLAYTFSRAYVLEVIALGVVAVAILAGVSWATVNNRGVQRDRPDPMALSVSRRVLLLHAAGATLTVVLAVLIAIRVV